MTLISLGGGGEFDRIRQIADVLGDAAGPLGDDTAPIPPGEGTLVVSTDISLELIHFNVKWLSLEEIGWRATASALSDLAAAGAKPAGITIGLGVPDAAPDEVLAVMRGVGACARSVGTRVLGGDLSEAFKWTLSVTVFGHAIRPMSRVGAKPGDTIWVTGNLGGSHAAWFDWVNDRAPSPGSREVFAHPIPRLVTGQWLAAHGATAMMDISDGLAGDALHIAAASQVHLEIDIERLPVHPDVPAAAKLEGETPVNFAAIGGEDYELLVTLPAGWDLADECERATQVPLTRIGSVQEGTGVTTNFHGVPVSLNGFRHAV